MDVAFYPNRNDANRWLALHSVTHLPSSFEGLPKLEFECRCTMLTRAGRCAIWEDRPMICELFIAGGPQCIEAVRKRRTHREYRQIRGSEDPVFIHEGVEMRKIEGINKIEALINEILDQEDDMAIDLLEEMGARASAAQDAREEEIKKAEEAEDEDDDVEDAEDEVDEEEDEGESA